MVQYTEVNIFLLFQNHGSRLFIFASCFQCVICFLKMVKLHYRSHDCNNNEFYEEIQMVLVVSENYLNLRGSIVQVLSCNQWVLGISLHCFGYCLSRNYFIMLEFNTNLCLNQALL